MVEGAEADGRGRRGIAYTAIAFDPTLSRCARMLYVAMTTYADKDREFSVGSKALARVVRCGRDKIRLAQRELVEAKFLKVETALAPGRKKPGSLYHSGVHRFTLLDRTEENPGGTYGFVYCSVLDRDDLSARAIAVYMALAIHAQKLRLAWRSYAGLAKEIGFADPKTVMRAIQELEEAGVVTKHQKHRGDPDEPENAYFFAPNRYQLHEKVGVQRVTPRAGQGTGAGAGEVTPRAGEVTPRAAEVTAGAGEVTNRTSVQDQEQDHRQDQKGTGPGTRSASPAARPDAASVPAPDVDPASERTTDVDLDTLAEMKARVAAAELAEEHQAVDEHQDDERALVGGGIHTKDLQVGASPHSKDDEPEPEAKVLRLVFPKFRRGPESKKPKATPKVGKSGTAQVIRKPFKPIDVHATIRQHIAEGLAAGKTREQIQRKLGAVAWMDVLEHKLFPKESKSA